MEQPSQELQAAWDRLLEVDKERQKWKDKYHEVLINHANQLIQVKHQLEVLLGLFDDK